MHVTSLSERAESLLAAAIAVLFGDSACVNYQRDVLWYWLPAPTRSSLSLSSSAFTFPLEDLFLSGKNKQFSENFVSIGKVHWGKTRWSGQLWPADGDGGGRLSNWELAGRWLRWERDSKAASSVLCLNLLAGIALLLVTVVLFGNVGL